MFKLEDLIMVFEGDAAYAWEILYSEILLHHSNSVDKDHIKQLIELYSRGMEKLNNLEQSSNNYFKSKINELMGQKRVIRCLNDQRTIEKESEDTLALPNAAKTDQSNFDRELQSRKRELEIRLAYGIEASTALLKNIINEEKVKEIKIQRIVSKIINSEQQKLIHKIKKRQNRVSNSRNFKRELQQSMQLTESSELNDSQNIDPRNFREKLLIEEFSLSECSLEPYE